MPCCQSVAVRLTKLFHASFVCFVNKDLLKSEIKYAVKCAQGGRWQQLRHDKGEIGDRFTWATGSVHLTPVPLSALPRPPRSW